MAPAIVPFPYEIVLTLLLLQQGPRCGRRPAAIGGLRRGASGDASSGRICATDGGRSRDYSDLSSSGPGVRAGVPPLRHHFTRGEALRSCYTVTDFRLVFSTD